jgi:hypothetical protein
MFGAKAALLFAGALIIHFFLSSMVAIEGWSYGLMRFLAPTALVIAGTALVLVTLFQILELSKVYATSPYVTALFAPPEFFFYWLVGPLVVMLIFSRA